MLGKVVADLLYRKGKHTFGSEFNYDLKEFKLSSV
jgi:hypothetical protein